MSKMGISVISSYRGGCNFETVGLKSSFSVRLFSRNDLKNFRIGLIGIEKKIKEIHKKAYKKDVQILPIGGIYKYRKTGENHQFEGKLIHTLQHAVTTGSYETFKKYTDGINNMSPINLRDLLDFKRSKTL